MKSAVAHSSSFISSFNRAVGQSIAWLALFMILVQFTVVVMRYVFGVGSIFMQESIIYMHSLLFMIGAAYTLLRDGHVRVDVFYREAKPRTKARVDLIGSIIFLLPVSAVIFESSIAYVVNAWQVFEGSKETSGIQAVFLLKSLIMVFGLLMFLQGLAMAANAILALREPEETP